MKTAKETELRGEAEFRHFAYYGRRCVGIGNVAVPYIDAKTEQAILDGFRNDTRRDRTGDLDKV